MKIIITIALIILSMLPVLILGYFIYKKDSVKEPKTLLTKLFLAGLIASLVIVFIDIFIAITYPDLYLFNTSVKFSNFMTFILVFLEIGLIEEAIKWFVIRVVGYDSPEFDQIYDIVVYSVFVALGFAFFENIFYVIDGGIKLGILRGLLSVPAHAAYGVFMGYFLGKAKLSKKRGHTFLFIVLSIMVPALLHTTYDYILMFNSDTAFYILIGYMAILYMVAFQIIRYLSEIKKAFRKKKK